MINWRSNLYHAVWRARKNPKGEYISYLNSIQFEPPGTLEKLQDERLKQILFHVNATVPYYRKIFRDCGVVIDGNVNLQKFTDIPLLTKEIIRREGENLYAQDYQNRHFYVNTSGGSTGEPVTFIQDYDYSSWSYAVHRYFQRVALRELGEPMIKLWGSERDVFQGSETWTTRLTNWLENITLLNSFVMSETNIERYVERWNRTRPRLVLAYTSSMLEFARYIEHNNISVYTPRAIVCSAEVLTEAVRSYIEKVMRCPVLNQYGSREVSLIACECPEKQGLHVFSLFNKVEILDEQLHECGPGIMGNIVVTNLANYSMPIIRYQIGDTAVSAERHMCTCGRGWPLIGSVTGRQSDHFCTRQGTLIHGEYFTHLFYNRPDIKQFQVVQRDYEQVEVFIVPQVTITQQTHQDITDKIRLVMGDQCDVIISLVDDIARSSSGKFRYTISQVKDYH